MDRFPSSRLVSGLVAASCRRGCKCALSVLLTLLLVSLLGAQANAAPSANLNGVDGSTIHGWAWDSALPNSSVSVDVYDGTNFLTTVVANTIGPSGGNHGFNLVTPASLKDGLTHSISVKFSGTTTNVGNSPLSYTYVAPAGVYTAGAGLALSPGHQFSVAPGGVVPAMIANGAVTTSAIANGSVTAAQLAPGLLGPTAPNGPAGGSLTGTYPNPTVAAGAIDHTKLASDLASLSQVSAGLLTDSDGFHVYVTNDLIVKGSVIAVQGSGGGTGNNNGVGRAIVDGGPANNLIINYANDFGRVDVQSELDVHGALGLEPGDIYANNPINIHQDTTVHGTFGVQGGNFGVDGVVNLGDGDINSANPININKDTTIHGALSITGGSDLAEPYKVAMFAHAHPLPGMVVTIDPTLPGQMRVSTRPYDTTVGGILSGANGVHPGIVLRQTGTIADGTLPVASIGRVWCWCDAGAGGPIHPGDLLTTSATPGHAMRVRDYDKARGAILGKAMSTLKTGKGLVLVLVTLE